MKKLYSLFAVAAIAVTVSAQTNLITNPGFENWTAGKPDGWYTSGITFTQSTNPVHSGTYAAGVEAPASSNKTTNPTPDIPVTQGVTYVYSGWYLDNVTNAKFKYWNQFRTASADTGGNNMQSGSDSVNNPAWVQFYAEAQPNANAVVARPGLRVYPETGGSGVIYFDDIMFYDKATLSTIDIKEFDKQVKMNTLVENELKLQLPSKSTVNIYSVDGKLISSNRVNDGESINVSHLNTGNYLVTVQDNFQNKISRKIIKK
ncbi:MAG: T9SS type A sorting domain-containing protein [Bacteroidetes bacterium]|nr:T9SS type A sorting domain-containing protein [Bacteroidota bacterium]